MIAQALALLVLSQSPAEADTSPPVINFVPCEAAQKGRAFTVYARFDDASALFEPKLVYRVSGESTWRNAPFKPPSDGSAWRASVPSRELTGALEYFVEVFDENGNGPARVGSPEQPLFARVTRKAPECARPDQSSVIAAAPVEVATDEAAPQSLTTAAPEAHSTSRCQPGAFYCKPWFWLAAGGAAAVVTGVVVAVASSHATARGYPDHVTLVVQPQAVERGR